MKSCFKIQRVKWNFLNLERLSEKYVKHFIGSRVKFALCDNWKLSMMKLAVWRSRAA